MPSRKNGAEECVQRRATNPGLNAEPAAGDDRPHQRRKIRAERSVRRAREDREGYAVLRSRMRIEKDGREHDGVAEENGDERLPPVHAGADESR